MSARKTVEALGIFVRVAVISEEIYRFDHGIFA